MSQIDNYNDLTPRRFQCGHELIWDNSECAQDVDPTITDENSVYNFYHCPHCGAFFSMLDCNEEEKGNYDYWKER